eukprot:tig00000448_g926.t1
MSKPAYEPGEIGSLLSGGTAKKKKGGAATEPSLAALFSNPQAAMQPAGSKAPSKKAVAPAPKKRRSHDKVSDESSSSSDEEGERDEPAAAAAGGGEEDGGDAGKREESKREAKRRREEEEADKNGRTVFVGNLAVSVTRKELKRMFGVYGEVESVRLRSIVAAKEKMPRKVAFITGSFGADTCNAYVVFAQAEEAAAAQAHNGTLVAGKRLRVDLATAQKDPTRSVFVGNLPLDAEEDALWAFFEERLGEGALDKVRLVRDKTTHKGKGFGFVHLRSAATVPGALKLHATEFEGRALRVFRALPEEKAAAVKAVRSGAAPGASAHSVLQSKERTRDRGERPWQGLRASKTIEKKKGPARAEKARKGRANPGKPKGARPGKEKKQRKLKKAGLA